MTSKESEVRGLRREIGLLGAFSMGFADVGADVFLAIGIVTLYAAGFSPLAFLIASICYITTGLVYAELTSLYPLAGGGQVFGLRAGGDLLGFVVGWAILLDYILDIGLFSIISAGYLSYLFPSLSESLHLNVLGVSLSVSKIGIAAFVIVIFLILINLIGIKESSRFNEFLVLLTLSTEILILVTAFLLAFKPDLFIEQLKFFGSPVRESHVFYTGLLPTNEENFIYAVTLAMSSFIGIESIAQAAEETRNPWKYIPKSFKYSIVAVVFFTLSFSILGLGVMGWEGLSEAIYNPIAAITAKVPYFGVYMASGVALVAFLITLVSTNTGVIGVSRVSYSMSKFRLIPRAFSKLHEVRAVPYISIIFFGLIGGALALTGDLEMVAGLYNFGALLSYILVNYSHIKIRMVDKESYRHWKTPLNIKIKGHEISLIAVFGLLSTSILFTLVVVYHPLGRILGFSWVSLGILLFVGYRIYQRRSIREKMASKLLKPIITRLRTIVVVPSISEPQKIYRTIYNNLEDIHELILVSRVDIPPTYIRDININWKDIYRLKSEVESFLESICILLRASGYKCSYYCLVGPEESLERFINEANPDAVVLISGKKPRGKGKRREFININKNVSIMYLYIPEIGEEY